jgi:protein-disulfide isomerase
MILIRYLSLVKYIPILVLLIATQTQAGDISYSDSLSKQQQKKLTTMASDFKMKTPCHGPLLELAKHDSSCVTAQKLYNFAAWLILKDSTPDFVHKQLQIRYDFFTTADTVSIDTTGFPHIGDKNNPVLVAVYASSTCNLCKVIVRAVEDSILHGSLNHKAQLVIKPFSAGIGDMAKMAAFRQHRYKEYSDALAQITGRFTEKDLITIADSIGLDMKDFTSALKDSTTRGFLLKSRAEGMRNGVEVTPTFFINSKRYHSYKDPQWLIDAMSVIYRMRH